MKSLRIVKRVAGGIIFLLVLGVLCAALAQAASAQTITTLIRNGLDYPKTPAVDEAGNVYVAGGWSNNVVRITPGGEITEIIDASGDGLGNQLYRLFSPRTPIVDEAGNVYVAGEYTNNVFRITPEGQITQIIDESGDGRGNGLRGPETPALDEAGNVYVSGRSRRWPRSSGSLPRPAHRIAPRTLSPWRWGERGCRYFP